MHTISSPPPPPHNSLYLVIKERQFSFVKRIYISFSVAAISLRLSYFPLTPFEAEYILYDEILRACLTRHHKVCACGSWAVTRHRTEENQRGQIGKRDKERSTETRDTRINKEFIREKDREIYVKAKRRGRKIERMNEKRIVYLATGSTYRSICAQPLNTQTAYADT